MHALTSAHNSTSSETSRATNCVAGRTFLLRSQHLCSGQVATFGPMPRPVKAVGDGRQLEASAGALVCSPGSLVNKIGTPRQTAGWARCNQAQHRPPNLADAAFAGTSQGSPDHPRPGSTSEIAAVNVECRHHHRASAWRTSPRQVQTVTWPE